MRSNTRNIFGHERKPPAPLPDCGSCCSRSRNRRLVILRNLPPHDSLRHEPGSSALLYCLPANQPMAVGASHVCNRSGYLSLPWARRYIMLCWPVPPIGSPPHTLLPFPIPGLHVSFPAKSSFNLVFFFSLLHKKSLIRHGQHLVATCANIDILRDFLSQGASVHLRNRDGRTPLFLAAEAGIENNVELLKESGAHLHADEVELATLLKTQAEEGHGNGNGNGNGGANGSSSECRVRCWKLAGV